MASASSRTRSSGSVCVVHLVRAGNDPEPHRAFFDSYRRHAAGIPHELLLLLKGFTSRSGADQYRALAGDLPSRELRVSDHGFDLNAYFEVVKREHSTYLCFVNSFSTILVDGWLAMLREALRQPGVGIVSATGSWASQRSCMLYQLGAPNAYARAYESRRRTRAEFRAHTSVPADPGARQRPIARRFETARGFVRQAIYFDPFPAYHLRTNAFMATRHTLARVRVGPLQTKLDAYRLESGTRSITKQIEAMGSDVLVVGRDGTGYHKADWDRSDTFWQADQDNLLVADNQTREYERGDVALRLLLSRFAWGDRARPALGSNSE